MTGADLVIEELAASEAHLLDIIVDLTIENARLRTVAERELCLRLRGDLTIQRLKAQLREQECAA